MGLKHDLWMAAAWPLLHFSFISFAVKNLQMESGIGHIHGIGSGERVGVVFPTLRGGAEGGGSAQPQRGGRVGAVPE